MPASTGESLEETASAKSVADGPADDLRVVWARVKGYPHWPAQVMDAQAAAKWLAGVKPGKGCKLPIMFFGTKEVCWAAPATVVTWPEGLAQGFKNRLKKDKRLQPSIDEAEEFFKGKLPSVWWSLPEPEAKTVTVGFGSELGASHPLEAELRRHKVPRTEPPTSFHAPRISAPAAPLPADACSGAMPSSMQGQAGPDAAPAERRRGPARIAIPGNQAMLDPCASHALPKYEFARRNAWPSTLSKPKRITRDDIPVCDCRATPPAPTPPAPTAAEGIELQARESQPPLERGGGRARAATAAELGKTDCGPDCINRQSFVHCDPKTCPCGDACTNRPFHQLPLPKMTVFHTGDRGWGVRAEETIRHGSFVVEYTGELLDKGEKQRRLEVQARDQIHDFYMMEHSPGVIIDARLKGNLARFLNSSCDPNCETQKWRDAATNEVRIGIFARRDIRPGEELAYDYNFEHSGLAEQAGAYRCRCGAASCRGTMDTKPDRLKDAYRRIEVFWDGDQRYYRGTVLGFQAGKGVHLVQYDDGQRTREDLRVVKHRWLSDNAAFLPNGHEDGALPPPSISAGAMDARLQNGTAPPEAAELAHEIVEAISSDPAAATAIPGTGHDLEGGAAEQLSTAPDPTGAAGQKVLVYKPKDLCLPTDTACGQSVLLSLLRDALTARQSHAPGAPPAKVEQEGLPPPGDAAAPEGPPLSLPRDLSPVIRPTKMEGQD